MFHHWQTAIAACGIEKELKRKSRVCELHFQSGEIIRFNTITLDDRPITIPCGRPTLKKDAIPSIFPPTKQDFYYYNPKSVGNAAIKINHDTTSTPLQHSSSTSASSEPGHQNPEEVQIMTDTKDNNHNPSLENASIGENHDTTSTQLQHSAYTSAPSERENQNLKEVLMMIQQIIQPHINK